MIRMYCWQVLKQINHLCCFISRSFEQLTSICGIWSVSLPSGYQLNPPVYIGKVCFTIQIRFPALMNKDLQKLLVVVLLINGGKIVNSYQVRRQLSVAQLIYPSGLWVWGGRTSVALALRSTSTIYAGNGWKINRGGQFMMPRKIWKT